MDLSLGLSILAGVISVSSLVLARKDKAVKDAKETNMELVKYQLAELKEDYKDIASDIKEIKKMLDVYKDDFSSIVKEQLEEHIKIYHK